MKNEKRESIQISGTTDDQLIQRLKRFAAWRGLQLATAARMLIKDALDREGVK